MKVRKKVREKVREKAREKVREKLREKVREVGKKIFHQLPPCKLIWALTEINKNVKTISEITNREKFQERNRNNMITKRAAKIKR